MDEDAHPGPVRKTWQWLLENWDVALALVLAVVFAVLQALEYTKDDTIRGITLVVLGLMAIALVRLRAERSSSKKDLDDVRRTLQTVSGDIAALESGAPWRILDCELTWDMHTPTTATFTKSRKLRFNRNEVLVVHDWFASDGRSTSETCAPGTFVDEPRPKIGEREYSLIAFPTFYKRGDEMQLTITRDLEDSFPAETNEDVGIAIVEETLRARMRVIWPEQKRPNKVWVQGNRVANREVDVKILAKEPDGRVSLTYDLFAPEVGDSVNIFWNW